MKKGQTAVEYIIILAVVIIIALIVIGVMGGFQPGGFMPGTGNETVCTEAMKNASTCGVAEQLKNVSFTLPNNTINSTGG